MCYHMKIGTKSVLFGVHQFLWHPLTVGLAWRKLYGVWPRAEGWVAIFCHDLGYSVCTNIDGPEGRLHPERGAKLALKTARRLGMSEKQANLARVLAITHSREYLKRYMPTLTPGSL